MQVRLPDPLCKILPGPMAVQAILALGVLLIALSPASHGTALYLPLTATSPARTVAWSRAHGAALVAPGPYRGSFFIRVPTGNLTGEALQSGALLFVVPEFLCGRPAQTKLALEP
ncbi:hypothetical protein [Novosphingobium sp. BW1]|uniref:hypothetical protein n=1 Tax=Novosphingobium sp. BW1 TaxID=2592621 RepID=UPI0011DE8E31|nr:hypothetical protein [Novosphingobium sp. BW1]TYC86874.1 hypothetical protein FMM79_13480 [Novosphingobium sp. BW1]